MAPDPSLRAGLEHLIETLDRQIGEIAHDPDDPKGWERDGYFSGLQELRRLRAAVADLLRAQPPDLNPPQFFEVSGRELNSSDFLWSCYCQFRGLFKAQGHNLILLTRSEFDRLTGRAQPPPAPDPPLADAPITDTEAANLRYARGLLRKAASCGASFVDINADVLRYLVESRRRLNDRLRWAEHRAQPPPAPDLREAFRAGFLAHPDREAPSGFYWSFAPDTCMAADREPSAWEAWLAAPPAVEGTRP